MLKNHTLSALFLALVLASVLPAQTGLITTIAGTGVAGTAGVGGPAVNAQIGSGTGICIDPLDNLYIADASNNRVVRIDGSSGVLTLVAGSGQSGYNGDGIPATQASLSSPRAVALDASGNLYIADTGNYRIRRVDAVTGVITSIAGTGVNGFGNDGGAAVAASISYVTAINFDSSGSLYMADSLNNRIRRIDGQTGIITTVAGNGSSAVSPDGSGLPNISLSSPYWVGFDRSGNMLVSEYGSGRIRSINLSIGVLGTVAGNGSSAYNGDGEPATSAAIGFAPAVTVDPAGNLFFPDMTGRIRRVDAISGQIITVAGNGSGFEETVSSSGGGGTGCYNGLVGDNQPATIARVDGAYGMAVTQNGNLVFLDWIDCRVRRVFLPSPNIYTNTTFSLNPASPTAGQPVTFTATVTPINGSGNPTGTVQFVALSSDGLSSNVIGTAQVTNGIGTFQTVVPSPGSGNIVAYYFGDSSFNGSGSPRVAVTIGSSSKATPNVYVASGQNPAPINTPVVFSVAVVPPAGNTNQPTGAVEILDGSTGVGGGSLTGGQAQISVTFTTSGPHTISVAYQGDINFAPATSASISESITTKTPTTVAVAQAPSGTTTAGSTVSFMALVTPSAATGTVVFSDTSTTPATTLGSATLSNGVATISYSTFTAGTHSIVATYQGDSNYAGAASSPVSSVVVNSTTITLTSNMPSPSNYAQGITITATIAPSTATGTIYFYDNGSLLAYYPVSNGTAATSSMVLSAGTHTITATYSGDANDASSTSNAITQVVNKVTPTVTLSVDHNPAVLPDTVNFTVLVAPPSPGAPIQLLDGQTVIASTTSQGPPVSFAISSLSPGVHNITAVMTGDTNLNGATSNAVSETMQSKTTVSLTSQSQSTSYGQPVTLTASLSPAAATGTVQFTDGATNIGSATLSGGSAALTVSTLASGTHQIVATYSGDGVYLTSQSATWSQTVTKAATAVALVSSLNPSNSGQSVSFTATVSPSSSTGSVQFLDGTTVLGTATVTNGTAAFATSALTAGSHSITATYSGDSNYNTATATLTQTVKAASTTTLSANPATATIGQTVQLTASVSPSSASGTVQFLDGSTVLGTVNIGNGTASLSVSTLALGSHAITAVYSGDASDTASNSTAVNVSINKIASGMTLMSSLNPSNAGQSVTFTAAVTPAAATGTVQFLDGATVLGTVPLSNGAAAFTTSSLAAGGHAITASYSGDSNDSSASTSITQIVKAVSATTLSATPVLSTFGQTVTIAAAVSPAGATGTVQFLDGSTVLGAAAVSNGTAAISVSTFAVGSHSLSAVYSGDGGDTPSNSNAVAVTVNKAAPAVTLMSSTNPSVVGQPVTFTAIVAPAAATGSVQFKDGTTVIGTASLSGGPATFSSSSLNKGNHSITAVYSGDSNVNPGQSSVLNQVVNTPPPAAPTNLMATATSATQINLSWTASTTSGAKYNVYASTTSGFTPSASNRIAGNVGGTSYSNNGLSPSTTYYYLVTAVNSAGESAPTNEAGATTQSSSISCHVDYTVTTQWNVGFGTAITIQNTGSTAINGWELTWTWPGNQQITQAWNSNYSQQGASASLTNASWNSTIAPRATLSGMGFNASYSGSNPPPSAFYVNGTLCH